MATLISVKIDDGALRNSMGQLISVMSLHNASCPGVSPVITPMESEQAKIEACTCKRYLSFLKRELGQ